MNPYLMAAMLGLQGAQTANQIFGGPPPPQPVNVGGGQKQKFQMPDMFGSANPYGQLMGNMAMSKVNPQSAMGSTSGK